MKFLTTASIVATIVLAAGCAEPRYGSTAPQVISSPSGDGTYASGTQKAETDRALENQVRQSLANGNPSYLTSRLNILASNGTVTLSGSVPTAQDRQELERLVRNTTGVNSVIDQTRIEAVAADTARTSSPVYSGTNEEHNTPESDRLLADRLQQALRSNAASAPLVRDINVSSQNGAVTLTGSVPSEQQRQVVDNVVRNVSGVKSVYDQMQIAATATGRSEEPRSYSTSAESGQHQTSAAGGSMSAGDVFSLHVQGLNETDRNLAQQILQGLKNDSTLASMLPSVNINVAGGRVVLEGNVETQQQKQAIGSVVERAAGGNNVANELRVNGR